MNNSENSRFKKTVLLTDAPTAHDDFGPHERIATAIHDLILDTDQGSAIGLIGEWGSGKSTVVTILDNQLKKSAENGRPQARVFSFDAWVHQGDPLRRSFLDELVEFLLNERLLGVDEAKKHRDKLRQREETIESDSRPLLTSHGKLFIFATFLIPLGVTLAPSTFTWSGFFSNPLQSISLAFVVAPLLVALGIYVYWRPTWRLWHQAFWTKHRHPYEYDSVVSLFVHKIRQFHETRTIRTSDHTTIEFRDAFMTILSEAFAGRNDKLVIAMDNIDRLPADQARVVWSTMQTFFERPERHPRSNIPDYWLIVAFSESALASRFRTPEETATATQQSLWEKENSLLWSGFIDKTFQTVFRVPPLVMTDWRQYLLDRLAEAFPEHSHTEFQIVSSLYAEIAATPNRVITPRDLKLFVNKMVVLYRQRGEEIPLRMYAVYVLKAGAITGSGGALLADEFLTDRQLDILELDEWRKPVAALYFNVELDKAVQVLIRNRVRTALAAGEEEELATLANVEGFFVVTEEVVGIEKLSWEPEGGEHLAVAARAIGSLSSVKPDEAKRIWAMFRRVVPKIRNWGDMSSDVASGLTAIMANTPPKERATLSGSIRDSLSQCEVPEPKPDAEEKNATAKAWIDAAIVAFTDDWQPDKLGFPIPGSVAFNIDVLELLAASDLPENQVRHFKPSVTREVLMLALTEEAKTGRLRQPPIKFIQLFLSLDSDLNWTPLIDAVGARLSSNETLPAHEVAQAAKLLLALARGGSVEHATKTLENVAIQGYLAHFLATHRTDAEVAVVLLLTMLLMDPGAEQSQEIWQSQNGYNEWSSIIGKPQEHTPIVHTLAKLSIEVGAIEDLIIIAGTHPNTGPLVASVVGAATAEGTPLPISVNAFIDNQDFFQRYADFARSEALVSRMVTETPLLDRLCEREFSLNALELYLWCLEHAPKPAALHFTTFLVKGLRTLDMSTWTETLSHDTESSRHLANLCRALKGKRAAVNLTVPLHDALRDVASNARSGAMSVTDSLKGKVTSLIPCLQLGSRRTLASNLVDDLYDSGDATQIEPVLDVFGIFIRESGALSKEPDKTVRRVFAPIASAPTELTALWLSLVINNDQTILENSDSDSQQDFKDRISETLSGSNLSDGIRTPLNEIAKVLGLPTPKEVKPVPEEAEEVEKESE